VVGAEVVGYGTAGTFSQSGGIQVIGGGSATAPNLDLGFYPIPHASSIETLLND
jgi:type V secretory pathway adhesin AidA